MTGSDLFRALNGVDDALVAEAESYTIRRVIPMRTVRWVSTVAACLCLLVCAAVVVRSGLFSMKSTESAMPEAKAEAMIEEETVITEETATEETVEEEIMTETTEEGGFTAGDQLEDTTPTQTEGITVIDRYMGDDKAIYCSAAPENGEWFCEEYLRQMVEMYGEEDDVRFLVMFYLWKDGEMLQQDSAEYTAETERLAALGYEFRLLNVPHTDKSVKYQVCGLLTAEQLKNFAASEAYGFVLGFTRDEFGEPLNWEEQIFLCGTPENAE